MNLYTSFVLLKVTVVGYDTDAVMTYEKYDVQNNNWKELGSTIKPHYKFGTACGANKTIYLIGGKTKVIFL